MPRLLASALVGSLVGATLLTGACGGKRIHGDNNDDAGSPPPPIDGMLPIDARATPPIPPDCLAAADRGLAWLVARQNPDGSWGDNVRLATTAFSVLKIETYAREIGQSPFDPGFVYATQVAAGLRYVFTQAQQVAIGPQLHGNPDSNGNGVALLLDTLNYQNAVGLMAIVAGAEPNQVVVAPGSAVHGRTFRSVAEDLTDYLVYGQTDASVVTPEACARGGWRYDAADNDPSSGDNSVAQFVTLALEYARNPAYGYELDLPAFVSTELRHWVDCIQNRDGGPDDGASGYTSAFDWLNAYKTGAVVQQFSFLGDLPTDPNAARALAYLHRTWNDTSGVGWRSTGFPPTSDYLAMYSIMKSMESMAVTDLNGIDWYRQFCDQLKLEQLADGSWPSSSWENEPFGQSGMNSTQWALLVLERAAPPPEVIP